MALGVGNVTSGTDTGTAYNVTLPSCSVGDLLLLFLGGRRVPAETITVPTGWVRSQEITETSGSNQHLDFLWKVAESGDSSGSLTLSFTGSTRGLAWVAIQVTGAELVAAVDDTKAKAQTDGTTPTAPSINTSVGGKLMFVCYTSDTSTANGTPTGFTSDAGISSAVTNNRAMRVAHKTVSANAATGTVAASSGTNDSLMVSVVCREKNSGGPPIYISAGTAFSSASVDSTTLGLAPYIRENDALLVQAVSRNAATVFTFPAGWTRIFSTAQTDLLHEVWWKRATSSESAPSVSFTNRTQGLQLIMSAFRSAAASGSIVDAEADSSHTTSTTMTADAVTTTQEHSTITRWYASANNSTHSAPSAGQLRYQVGTTAGNDMQQSLATELEGGVVGTNSGTATMTIAATNIYNSATIAISRLPVPVQVALRRAQIIG